jgi:hypothetical protein
MEIQKINTMNVMDNMKVPNIGFHENPHGVKRVVLMEGSKDTPKLIVDDGHFLPTRLQIN